MAKRYPDEAPLFKITGGEDQHIRIGATVEGFGQGAWHEGEWWSGPPSHLCVRALSHDDIVSEPSKVSNTYAVYGFFGCQVAIHNLHPLTPAARAMLAIARERAS